MAKFAGIVCLVLMCIVVVAPHAKAIITCGQVVNSLRFCISYVIKGGNIPPGCCDGIRSLNSAARTPADRRATCACLKSLASSIPNINPGLVAGLPGKCGVSIPYPISPKTDCSKVN